MSSLRLDPHGCRDRKPPEGGDSAGLAIRGSGGSWNLLSPVGLGNSRRLANPGLAPRALCLRPLRGSEAVRRGGAGEKGREASRCGEDSGRTRRAGPPRQSASQTKKLHDRTPRAAALGFGLSGGKKEAIRAQSSSSRYARIVHQRINIGGAVLLNALSARREVEAL